VMKYNCVLKEYNLVLKVFFWMKDNMHHVCFVWNV